MKSVKVLGPGCPRCEKLKQMADEAVAQSGVEATVEKITDMNEITGYGVMMTPALVVDEQVKLSGRVPSLDEIKQLLAE